MHEHTVTLSPYTESFQICQSPYTQTSTPTMCITWLPLPDYAVSRCYKG